MGSEKNPLVRLVPYAVLMLLALTVGCGGGSPVPCDADILVTKTDDTHDGVCSGGDCSLREAVIHANACAGAQTIRVPAGTYILDHHGRGEDAAASGDLDLTDDVTVLGESQTVVDGHFRDRVFDVHPGVTASLSTLIIQHGREQLGGGIRNRGTLNVNESVIRNNNAILGEGTDTNVDGGGIYSEGNGSLGIYLSEIANNTAVHGGGIAVALPGGGTQTVMISYSQVTENAAERDGGGVWLAAGASSTLVRFGASGNTAGWNGGAVYNAGDLELTYADIEGNSVVLNGGGIYNTAGATVITRTSSLVGNQAESAGGGIFNLGMAHFYQTLIHMNEAIGGMGGGVYTGADSGLLLNNTTVSNNLAISGGAGIRNEDGNLQIVFATITANENEGIHASGPGEMTMRNTILSGNADANCVGAPNSLGHNIDDGGTCGLDEPGDLPNTDPMLEPMGAGTSFLSTFPLQPGSPAIDSANPDLCSGVDQRGVIRPQGAGCDRGAHENETGGAGSGLISGKVWHDLCAVPFHGYPPTPPPGCSDPDGDGHFIDANGIREDGEPGIPGVTVRLMSGPCAAATDLRTAVTGAEGEYSFPDLAPGTYCVSIDALGDGNPSALIPGGWTFPDRGCEEPVRTEIVLGGGETRSDVNFGWDFQFLPMMPDYLTPTPTPAALSFVDPWVSTKELFFAGPNALPDCGPREAKFQIGLSSLEGVANVNLFVRLKEQSSGKLGAWTSGIPMSPIGNNLYLATVPAEDIPEARTFGPAWVQYQFVALDSGGNAIGRSEVYWNIVFARCEYRPKTQQ